MTAAKVKRHITNGHGVGSTASNEFRYEYQYAFTAASKASPPQRLSQSSAVSATSVACSLALAAALALDSPTATPFSIHETLASPLATRPFMSQRTKAEAAIALLDEWLNDDSGYDEEAWPKLKTALDEDRLSDRRFFDA